MRRALVTGGAGGIGAAVCRRLAHDGFQVVIHYNGSVEAARALSAELQQATGREHPAIRADLTDRAQVEDLFLAAGPVDVLVNNAGIAQQKLFTDLTEEDWRLSSPWTWTACSAAASARCRT